MLLKVQYSRTRSRMTIGGPDSNLESRESVGMFSRLGIASFMSE